MYLKQGSTYWENQNEIWVPDLPQQPSGVFVACVGPRASLSPGTTPSVGRESSASAGGTQSPTDERMINDNGCYVLNRAKAKKKRPLEAGRQITQDLLFGRPSAGQGGLSQKDAQAVRSSLASLMLCAFLRKSAECKTSAKQQKLKPVVKEPFYSLLPKAFPGAHRVTTNGNGSLTTTPKGGTCNPAYLLFDCLCTDVW